MFSKRTYVNENCFNLENIYFHICKYYLDLNFDNSHNIKITTTTTAIIPVTAPALKIPVITSQLLSSVTNKKQKGKMNFFMGLNFN